MTGNLHTFSKVTLHPNAAPSQSTPHTVPPLSPFLFSSERVEAPLPVPPTLACEVSAGLGTSSPTESDESAQLGDVLCRQVAALGTAQLQLSGTHVKTELWICYICVGTSSVVNSSLVNVCISC